MYNRFKRLEKYTLRYTDRGLEKYIQSTTRHHLKNEKDNNYSIWLTKYDAKNCDTVKITSYDPDGNIQDSKFEFTFFDYKYDKKYFVVSISYQPEESKFWKGVVTPAYWKVEIIEESTPGVLRDIRGYSTFESEEIESILHRPNEDFRRKILSLIENFKYSRVVILQNNLPFNNMGGDENVGRN